MASAALRAAVIACLLAAAACGAGSQGPSRGQALPGHLSGWVSHASLGEAGALPAGPRDHPVPPPQPAAAGGGECEAEAAPDVDPFEMRLPSAGFGGLSEERGPFTDTFLASPSGRIRIGARREWGGAVVFFGSTGDRRTNVIDDHDPGRELQVALYDRDRQFQGCAWNASCVERPSACAKNITFLGWNPVQGGDECGRGSRVISARRAGDALEILAQPLQWNPDWEAGDCRSTPCPETAPGRGAGVRIRSTLRFVAENVVEFAAEVVSEEPVEHASSLQEFPTLYVSRGGAELDLARLLDAEGAEIAVGRAGGAGAKTRDFKSREPWVTWQNAAGSYGVGLAMDQGTRAFIIWRDEGEGAGRFRNVRPRLAFGLPAGGRVRGISYLALGGEAEVRRAFADLLGRRAPFGALESPPPGETASAGAAPVAIAGWALDTTAIERVSVFVDGAEQARLAVDQRRPDVCATYPGYGACPVAGFSGTLPAALFAAPCPRLVRVVATDPDGNERVLGERLVGR